MQSRKGISPFLYAAAQATWDNKRPTKGKNDYYIILMTTPTKKTKDLERVLEVIGQIYLLSTHFIVQINIKTFWFSRTHNL